MSTLKKNEPAKGPSDHPFKDVAVPMPAAPAVAPVSEALARALKCPASSKRDAVVSNLEGGAYRNPLDLEADLLWLESL